jgi:hypothetical protein
MSFIFSINLFSQNVFEKKTLKKLYSNFLINIENKQNPSKYEYDIINIGNINEKYSDNYNYQIFLQRRNIETIDFCNLMECYKFPNKNILLVFKNIDNNTERMISENKLIKFENKLKVFQKINYKEEKYAVFHFNKDGILLEETPKYVK